MLPEMVYWEGPGYYAPVQLHGALRYWKTEGPESEPGLGTPGYWDEVPTDWELVEVTAADVEIYRSPSGE